jgi:tetratricopeptide (TPR) repeat protein
LGEKEDATRHRQQLKELHAKQLRERIEESRRPNDLQATQQTVAKSYVAAGQLYLMRGDAPAAEQHWLRAVELDSRNEQGRAALTQLLERQGRLRDALRVLQPLVASLAEDAGFWLQLGQLQARLADHAQAEASFRHVVQLAPQRALGYVALARLHLQSETRAAEAVQCAREAVRCEPSAENYFLLSTACERAGDLPAAREAIEKALQLEPGNGQYRQTALALRNRS